MYVQRSSLSGVTFELLHFNMKLQNSIHMHQKARLLFTSTQEFFLSGQALYSSNSLAFRFWPILKRRETLMRVLMCGQVQHACKNVSFMSIFDKVLQLSQNLSVPAKLASLSLNFVLKASLILQSKCFVPRSLE